MFPLFAVPELNTSIVGESWRICRRSRCGSPRSRCLSRPSPLVRTSAPPVETVLRPASTLASPPAPAVPLPTLIVTPRAARAVQQPRPPSIVDPDDPAFRSA